MCNNEKSDTFGQSFVKQARQKRFFIISKWCMCVQNEKSTWGGFTLLSPVGMDLAGGYVLIGNIVNII